MFYRFCLNRIEISLRFRRGRASKPVFQDSFDSEKLWLQMQESGNFTSSVREAVL